MGYLKQVLALFAVAVALNYVWEVVQAPLYVGMEGWSTAWLHCFIASLGDGVLVWVILVIGWVTFRRFDWYVYPNRRAFSLMVATGVCIGVGVEWVAVNVLGRWAYTVNMPLLPIVEVGLVPVLQMILLPPVIFRIAARRSIKNDRHSSRPPRPAQQIPSQSDLK